MNQNEKAFSGSRGEKTIKTNLTKKGKEFVLTTQVLSTREKAQYGARPCQEPYDSWI